MQKFAHFSNQCVSACVLRFFLNSISSQGERIDLIDVTITFSKKKPGHLINLNVSEKIQANRAYKALDTTMFENQSTPPPTEMENKVLLWRGPRFRSARRGGGAPLSGRGIVE